MHYHLIGICGTAMASLAGMLQARGHKVAGSDENVYPPMSTMLEALGIPVMLGYKPEHLQPAPDCVVIGNALSRGNPEVEETLNRRLVYRSQAEVVKEEFIRGRRSLVVAGWDSPAVREVVAEMGDTLHTRLETFGTCPDARWQARDIDYAADDMTRFRVFRDGEEWGEFETPLIGDFNVRNCLSVVVAADAWGVPREEIKDALATFQSVKRRMQVRGRVRGVTV